MSRVYLKKAQLTPKSNASEVHETVKNILADIESGGDAKAKEYASKFDQYQGNIILTDDEIQAASDLVPEKLKNDIKFAHDNVKRFAERQKETLKNTEIEIHPGFVTGQLQTQDEFQFQYFLKFPSAVLQSVSHCHEQT